MAKDLHKSIALDDKFNKVLGRIQKSIEDLHQLADDFKMHDHTSVGSQVTALAVVAEETANLRGRFQDLRP